MEGCVTVTGVAKARSLVVKGQFDIPIGTVVTDSTNMPKGTELYTDANFLVLSLSRITEDTNSLRTTREGYKVLVTLSL